MPETQTKLMEELGNTEKGLYVYCVTHGSKAVNLGNIGVSQSEVYTINYKDISAVVHECAAEPYTSKDDEVVKDWVRAHQGVIDRVARLFGTVLPMTFNMIIRGGANTSPNEHACGWLKEEYDNFKEKLNTLMDKQEFGVQIFWDRSIISEKIAAENEEIRRLKDGLKKETRGKAYLAEQKIKTLQRAELEREADECFKTLYDRIRGHADNIKIEKVKKAGGEEMLANLSCLVLKTKVKELGAELDGINSRKGFSVRFTGPWPPYSFVSN